jgi:GTP pyrophosphokinase
VAKGIIVLKHIKAWLKEKDKPAKPQKAEPTLEQVIKETRGKKAGDDALVIGDNLTKIEYKLSPCCNPIPGDDVFGFITIGEGIKIHRVNCPNALSMMSNYAYRIVKARWTGQEQISFLAGIKVSGIDEVGLVNNVTKIISNELNVNMRSLNFDTHDGIFEGMIMLFVHDAQHLTELMKKLKKVNGVLSVSRINPNS